MKRYLIAVAGLILGAISGGCLGLVLGLWYVEAFNVSDFEGYSAYVVVYGFMPVAALIVGVAVAVILFVKLKT